MYKEGLNIINRWQNKKTYLYFLAIPENTLTSVSKKYSTITKVKAPAFNIYLLLKGSEFKLVVGEELQVYY